MSILLCVSIAWVTFCLLFVGLGLIVLLILEHWSNMFQTTIDDEGISDQAAQMANLDGAIDGPVQQVRELADAFDALAQFEDAVTLAPRDVILTAHSAAADRIRSTGVVIRDPRLTRARALGDQSGARLNATFVFPMVSGGRDTAA